MLGEERRRADYLEARLEERVAAASHSAEQGLEEVLNNVRLRVVGWLSCVREQVERLRSRLRDEEEQTSGMRVYVETKRKSVYPADQVHNNAHHPANQSPSSATCRRC